MLAPLLALFVAGAAPAPDGLSGVWEGTVGDLPVRACFAQGARDAFGAYYYLSHRRLIALEPEEGTSGAFREVDSRDPERPRWAVAAAEGDRLAGSWTQGRRRLALRLRRVEGTGGDEGACASLVFHAPRLAGVRTVAESASIDGAAYTRSRLAGAGHFNAAVESFALDGDGEAVRRINERLAEPWAGDPPEWFDCLRTALEQGPHEGDYHRTLAPVLVAGRWLSAVDRFDHYCGGNHPNHGQRYLAFDLSSGVEVDLHDWLGDAAVRRERPEWSGSDLTTFQPAFRDFILGGWTSGDAECDEIVRDHERWTIGLRRDGLSFAPDLPHVAQACGDEFILSFDRLAPFLTREGEQAVRAMRPEAGP